MNKNQFERPVQLNINQKTFNFYLEYEYEFNSAKKWFEIEF